MVMIREQINSTAAGILLAEAAAHGLDTEEVRTELDRTIGARSDPLLPRLWSQFHDDIGAIVPVFRICVREACYRIKARQGAQMKVNAAAARRAAAVRAAEEYGGHLCRRCGGAGGADQWRHTGWTCFDCGGRGWMPDPPLKESH